MLTLYGQDNAEIFTSRAIRELHIQPSIKIRPLVRTSNSPSIPFLLSLEVRSRCYEMIVTYLLIFRCFIDF